MNRFQSLLLAALLPVFFVTQAVSGYFVYLETREQITERSRVALITAKNNFKNHLSATQRSLDKSARVLATDLGFRQAVTSNETEIISSALQNLAGRGAIDNVVLVNTQGEVIADLANVFGERLVPAARTMLSKAIADGRASGVLSVGRRLFQSVIVPVLSTEPIAWIVVSSDINETTIDTLKIQSTLELDITFARLRSDEFDPLAISSLNFLRQMQLREQLAMSLDPVVIGMSTPIVELDDAAHITLVDNLYAPAGGPEIFMIVNASINAALKPYDPLFRFLAAVAALGFLVTALFAIVIARGITRPLRAMVSVLGKYRTGDYSHKLPVEGPQELQELARSLNTMASEIDERERQIFSSANFDPISGLANRSRAASEIDQLIEQLDGSGQLVVILVKLENLNEVRNTLGQEMASKVINSAVDRLNYLSAEFHSLAHVREDEFVLVYQNLPLGRIDITASQVALVFDRPVNVQGLNIDLQAHLGVAGYLDEALDSDTLIRRAELAAEIARERGRLFATYDQAYDEYMAERLSLISDLRGALESDRLEVCYQPKVDLTANAVYAVEALLRWQDSERGTVSPEIFIPLAERTGFIRNITSWVIRKALADCRRWRDAGYDVAVAINLSARDLIDERLADFVTDQINGAGVPVDAVVFEITESAVIESRDKAVGVIQQLRDLGIGIAIDDFGTGESSMSYLKELPASELKIDKAFVTGLQSNKADEIIVRSAVDLGHNLGMRVTAEGVEDVEAEGLLRTMGCDYGQGWLYAAPLPYDELIALLGTAGVTTEIQAKLSDSRLSN